MLQKGESNLLKPTLQKLSKEDDIESYLNMFERVAEQQGWPKELWSTQLGGLLSGEALDAFTSVPIESATDYDAVKEAILARYLVNAETYRLQFRDSHRGPGETYKLLLNRQTDLLKRWHQSAGSELKEIILLEQFLLSLPAELAVKLRERNPSTAKEAAEWADGYNLAHMGKELPESKPQPQPSAETDGLPMGHSDGARWLILLQRDLVPEAPYTVRPIQKESCSVFLAGIGGMLQPSTPGGNPQG